MKLFKALGLEQDTKNIMISFVGGGGKTSSILTLAIELAGEGKKVLITTTTAMYNIEGIIHPNITVIGDHITDEGKLKGLSKEKVNDIYKEGLYDIILVEADGAKRKPIKAPAQHEPVIPGLTNIVVGVIGMEAFGKKISSPMVHRPEILAELANTSLDGDINEEVLLTLVANSRGLFKNAPSGAAKVLLLNKAIGGSLREIALRIGELVMDKCRYLDRVLIGAVQESEPVKEILSRKR